MTALGYQHKIVSFLTAVSMEACKLLLLVYTRDRMQHGGTEWTHWAVPHSSQCSTTGVTKAMMCSILSVGSCMKTGDSWFLLLYLCDSWSYIRHHIAVNKICRVRCKIKYLILLNTHAFIMNLFSWYILNSLPLLIVFLFIYLCIFRMIFTVTNLMQFNAMWYV